MTTVNQPRVRGRPAHVPGPTFLAYTPNGRHLVTAGSNNVVRVYETGSNGEPVNVDDCQENNLAIAATNEYFMTGSEDGMVAMYSLESSQYEKMLIRCTLPIRDIAVSPDGQWAAVASDELTVKIVNVQDPTTFIYIRDCPKPAKHLTYDPSGSYLAISCTDGIVYIYRLSTEQPELVRKIDGLVRQLETTDEVSSRAIWHPDGRAFAVPTPTRDVQVISLGDGEKQRVFSNGHLGDITALAWSPNGALLLTAGTDKKVILWETRTQKALARYDYANVMNIVWHPTDNLVSFATTDGEIYIYQDFIQAEHKSLLDHALQPAPFIHDPLQEVSGNARKPIANGIKPTAELRTRRRGTPDSLDDILGPEEDGYDDDFVVDDDGAGYSLGVNGNGKRTNGHLDGFDDFPDAKRRSIWQPSIHKPFQPSSTPWRGNRRYLCLNLVGFAWTVDQDTHHTVTVEFYDREFHRDFHFTDPYLYDKACLNENGALFSCPSSADTPAMLYYRPHETWTTRADWRIRLPPGEEITSIALTTSFITATTSANYIRTYTLFGLPYRLTRAKATPAITCAAWRDYVLTIGNGPVGPTGSPSLLYSIENVRRGTTCQNLDTVAMPPSSSSTSPLKTVFFSDSGDPCIYDSDGVLLVLLHWRTPGQAQWVPLLDTRKLERLASGRKEERYWPVAVAGEKFHCIILKGGDTEPYFPRPLLSEFEFKIPISGLNPSSSKVKNRGDGDEDEDEENGQESIEKETAKLEEGFILSSTLATLTTDLLDSTTSQGTHVQRADLARRDLETDKILLQLINVECRTGEERGMKALELAGLLRDRSGRMLEAARKIAERYGRLGLGEKIGEVAERRLLGEVEGEEEGEDVL